MKEYGLGARKPNLFLCNNDAKDKSLSISDIILSYLQHKGFYTRVLSLPISLGCHGVCLYVNSLFLKILPSTFPHSFITPNLKTCPPSLPDTRAEM